jgi:heme/copper-type cytochrome/quinol oxidase subunit 2
MVLLLSAAVFVVVAGLIVYSLVRFRGRAAEQAERPQDQVLAGVIMWVPLAYLVHAALLTIRLLSPAKRDYPAAFAPYQ